MSRIRTIKPEFHQHEELSALPADAHLLAAALLNYADDCGYFNANAKLVKASCLPLREEQISTEESLILLSKIGYIRLGMGEDGKRYGHIVNFLEHQRVSHPTPSKISTLQINWEGSGNPTLTLNESSRETPENLQSVSALNGIEGNRIEGKGTLSNRARELAQNFTHGATEASESNFAKFRQLYPKPGNWDEAQIAWVRKKCDSAAAEIFADIPKRLAEHANWKQGAKFILNPENYIKREEWKNAIIPEPTDKNASGSAFSGKPIAQLRAERDARERAARQSVDRSSTGEVASNLSDLAH